MASSLVREAKDSLRLPASRYSNLSPAVNANSREVAYLEGELFPDMLIFSGDEITWSISTIIKQKYFRLS